MALIICDECGKEFSDKASACPNCGFPANNELNDNENTINEDKSSITSEKSTKKNKVEKIKLPVKIDGLEILKPEPSADKFISQLAGIVIIITIFLASESNYNQALYLIVGIALSLLLIRFAQPTMKTLENYKNTLIMNNYFKKRFKIVDSFDKTEYENIGMVEASADSDEATMFSIYKQAYLKDGDAIVLLSDKVSTDVHTNVSRSGRNVNVSTHSKKTYHIKAMVVKYKNVEYEEIEEDYGKCKKCSEVLSPFDVDICYTCKNKSTYKPYIITLILALIIIVGYPLYNSKVDDNKTNKKIEEALEKANKKNISVTHCSKKTGEEKIKCIDDEIEYQTKVSILKKTDSYNLNHLCLNPSEKSYGNKPSHWKYNHQCVYTLLSLNKLEQRLKKHSYALSPSDKSILYDKKNKQFRVAMDMYQYNKTLRDIGAKYGIHSFGEERRVGSYRTYDEK